ncbi:hypothetical protein [Neisseria animalis]|uniref:hypothetical protein n=1 Tax=Neisseria animalis TaxID=492 RepID=UPI000F4E2D0F|nr:hypothetical protein [Neisseria animalis]
MPSEQSAGAAPEWPIIRHDLLEMGNRRARQYRQILPFRPSEKGCKETAGSASLFSDGLKYWNECFGVCVLKCVFEARVSHCRTAA